MAHLENAGIDIDADMISALNNLCGDVYDVP